MRNKLPYRKGPFPLEKAGDGPFSVSEAETAVFL